MTLGNWNGWRHKELSLLQLQAPSSHSVGLSHTATQGYLFVILPWLWTQQRIRCFHKKKLKKKINFSILGLGEPQTVDQQLIIQTMNQQIISQKYSETNSLLLINKICFLPSHDLQGGFFNCPLLIPSNSLCCPPTFSRRVPFMYLSSETEHKALKVAEIIHLCTITHFYRW